MSHVCFWSKRIAKDTIEKSLKTMSTPTDENQKGHPPKRGATTQELQEVLCHEFGLPGNLTFKQAMRFIKDELTNLKKELAAEKKDHTHTAETNNDAFSRGLDLIVAERLRQIEEEGCDADTDDQYGRSELLRAAVCYTSNAFTGNFVISDHPCNVLKTLWPFDESWDKRGKHDQFRSLAIAGALIAAEIDRLFRKQEAKEEYFPFLDEGQKEVDLYPKWPNGTPVEQSEFDELRKKFANLARQISCSEDHLLIEELRGALTALRDAHRIRYGSTIFEITSRDGSGNYNIHELCKKDPDERVKVASGSEQTMVTNDYQASPHATPLEKAMEMHERHKDELRVNSQPYSPLVHTLDHIFEYLKKKDHEMKVRIPDRVTSVTKGEG